MIRSFVQNILRRVKDPMNFGRFDVNLTNLSWDALEILGDTPLEQAASLCEHSMSVMLFLGSGLSQESGLATFRGEADGLYTEEVLHLTHRDTFQTDPAGQLAWHRQWVEQINKAKPNRGHHALARMMAKSQARYTIVTQNVDALLEQALRSHQLSHEVHHVHGDLMATTGHTSSCPSGATSWLNTDKCDQCKQWLRPDVVWFGEELNAQRMTLLRQAAMQCDVCLLIGTSGVVYPAAAIPELAKESGARLIEINTHPTLLTSQCDVVIRDQAGPALSLLDAMLRH